MIDYAIAAIPTMYRGRRYRSRLEARWAAFFDLLGWRFEYEPFDLGKWSPDFGSSSLGGWSAYGVSWLLTEIKPITWPVKDASVCNAILAKMRDAVAGRGVMARSALLLLGASPLPIEDRDQLFLGPMWLPCADGHILSGALLGWTPDWHTPGMKPSVFPSSPQFTWMGGAFEHTEGPTRPYLGHTLQLWAEAANQVQYHPEARS